MAGFFYMVPDLGPHLVLLPKYGLDKRLSTTGEIVQRQCLISIKGDALAMPGAAGGEEHECTVYAQGMGQERVGFYPEDQEWRQVESETPHFWLGWCKGAKPGPTDLARTESIMGYFVKLRDGAEWLVPVARSFMPGTCLPELLLMGPGGKVVSHVTDAYRGLFDRAGAIAEQVYKVNEDGAMQLSAEVSREEKFALAVDALAVNYRIGIAEVNALELFDTQCMWNVILALIDFPTLKRIVAESAEKKDSAPGPGPT